MTAATMNATTAIIIVIIVGTGAPPYLIFIVHVYVSAYINTTLKFYTLFTIMSSIPFRNLYYLTDVLVTETFS